MMVPVKKRSILVRLSVSFSLLLLIIPCSLAAQKKATHDTSYYVSYPHSITARMYLSKKYTSLPIRGTGGSNDLRYRPNAKLNLGIGATYNNLSLNIGYGFSFLNKNKSDIGSTKGINLQLHLYPHKLTVDLLGIFLKGNYLDPRGYENKNAGSYYFRNDVKTTIAGIAAYRVPNAGKFSYRAAFVQNEWQKRSAGSVLYGGEAYYVSFAGDSALVPVQIATGYPQAGIKEIKYFTIGPGIGYAYTLVIVKHFFITASLIGNVDLNFSTEAGTTQNKKFSLAPAAVYKGAVGYNSDTWSIAGTITGNAMLVKGASSSKDYCVPTGNFRVSLAKKIMLKKH